MEPKRTIVYAAWDGEEAALLGSTEWVEQYDQELRQKAAVYINSDGNSRGFLQPAARTPWSSSSTTWHAASRIPKRMAPSGSAGRRARSPKASRDKRAESRTRANLRIGALGSGSDYTPFLQHHGTASLNLSFGGMDDDGIYHSIYDDFYHFTKFSDPGFRYGRALAQLVGTAVIRLADADVLPYEFTGLADTAQTYVKRAAGAAETAAGRHSGKEPSDRRRSIRGRQRLEATAADTEH